MWSCAQRKYPNHVQLSRTLAGFRNVEILSMIITLIPTDSNIHCFKDVVFFFGDVVDQLCL